MAVPGSNLLRQASRLIRFQQFGLRKWKGRVLNSSRQYIDEYAPRVDLMGSVQSIPRGKYLNLGLDFNKEYIKILASADMVGVERDHSGDIIFWDNKTYKLVEHTNWVLQDGWCRGMFVRVTEVPGL